MPRVKKPVLWWSSKRSGTDVISAALVDKKVWLIGCDIRQHTPFRINRRNLLTRIPWLGRMLFATWVTDLPTVYRHGGRMRSMSPWLAANLSQVPDSADYYFVDGNGGVSGVLSVSNTPTFRWRSMQRGGATLKPSVQVGLTDSGSMTAYARGELVELKREFEMRFSGVVLAPRDPEVEIKILEPWTSRDLLYETAFRILDRELRYIGPSTSSSYRYRRYLKSAIRRVESFLKPRDVDFSISGETRFTATTKKSTPVSLTLRGEGPLQLLFAVQVTDRKTKTSAISEFMPVVITQASSR